METARERTNRVLKETGLAIPNVVGKFNEIKEQEEREWEWYTKIVIVCVLMVLCFGGLVLSKSYW